MTWTYKWHKRILGDIPWGSRPNSGTGMRGRDSGLFTYYKQHEIEAKLLKKRAANIASTGVNCNVAMSSKFGNLPCNRNKDAHGVRCVLEIKGNLA
jgi:hypothetical protein